MLKVLCINGEFKIELTISGISQFVCEKNILDKLLLFKSIQFVWIFYELDRKDGIKCELSSCKPFNKYCNSMYNTM